MIPMKTISRQVRASQLNVKYIAIIDPILVHSSPAHLQINTLLSVSSLPIWIKALGMITPIHKEFAPLIYVIKLMLNEVHTHTYIPGLAYAILKVLCR